MSADQAKSFFEKAAGDEALAAQIRGANEVGDLVSAAQAAGFQVEASDFSGLVQGELSDADLENVAGGFLDAVGKYGGEALGTIFGSQDTAAWGKVGQEIGSQLNTLFGLKNVL